MVPQAPRKVVEDAAELSTTAHGAGIKGVRTLRNASPRENCASAADVAAGAAGAGGDLPVARVSMSAGDPLAASTVESWSHAELCAFVAGLGLKELLPNLNVLQADGRMIPVLMEEKMMQFAVDHKVKRTALVMAMRVAFSGGVKMALDWPVARVRKWLTSDGARTEKEAKRAAKLLVHGAFLASMPAEELMRVLKIASEEEAEQLASTIASNTELHDLADAVGLAMEIQAKGSGFANGNSGAWGDDESGDAHATSDVAGMLAFRGSASSQFGEEAAQMPGSPTRRQSSGSSPAKGGRIGVMRYSDGSSAVDRSNTEIGVDESGRAKGVTSSFLAQQVEMYPEASSSSNDKRPKGSTQVPGASVPALLPLQDFYATGTPRIDVADDPKKNTPALLLPLAQYQQAADDEAAVEEGIFSKIRWNRSDVLGRGAFGAVYRAFDMRTGTFIAVKELVQVDTDELREQVEEIRLLKDLVHPNVVSYLGASMREKTNDWGATEPVLCIATELMPGGSIASIVEQYGPLEEPVVQRYTCDILDGLSYLHSQKLVHRDIKPANCLVGVDGTVKLADFGESKKLSASMTGLDENRTMKGTPYFMAPEVLLEDGHGRRADIWSVGATVIAMATGHPPWRENGYRQIVQLVLYLGRNPEAVPGVPATCSEPLRTFLSLCFQRDPSKRLLAAKLREVEFLAMPAGELVALLSGEAHTLKALPRKDSEGGSTIKRIISTGERMIDKRRGSGTSNTSGGSGR